MIWESKLKSVSIKKLIQIPIWKSFSNSTRFSEDGPNFAYDNEEYGRFSDEVTQ